MSFTSTVPESLPSLLYSSLPRIPSSPAKTTPPPKAASEAPMTNPLPRPGFRSRTSEALEPLVRHSSPPLFWSAPRK